MDEQTTDNTTADAELGEGGQRALASERSARKESEKALKAANAKVDELTNAQAELQAKFARELAERDAQISALNLARERDHVLAEKGVPAALADFVQGGTREELEAVADKLMAGIPAAAPVEEKQAKWIPDPSQGSGSGSDMALNSDALTEALAVAVGAPVPGARF